MGLFTRMKNVLKKSEAPREEKSILTLEPGDIVEVSLVTYEVKGKVHCQRRKMAVLTLQDGQSIRYLKIEMREKTYFELYSMIDGRLDSMEEIPTSIEMDDEWYHLEEQHAEFVSTTGHTPFAMNGEQHVWNFQSDNRKLLRIEWQEGQMIMYEGEAIPSIDVQILRAK